MRPLVKICGITSKADALFCAGQGAGALGFIFYEGSPRYIDPARASRIIASLPPFVAAVGVFVNQDRRTINRVIRQTGIGVLQFSGDESPDDCEGYPLKTVKAFRIRYGQALKPLLKYRISAALLDGARDGRYGGSGQLADFRVAREMKKFFPVIVAGGLTPENVVETVRRVKPYAVDVNSGVESRPGRKDHLKIALLFGRITSVSRGQDHATIFRA